MSESGIASHATTYADKASAHLNHTRIRESSLAAREKMSDKPLLDGVLTGADKVLENGIEPR